jgi:ubiquinone/menaquinone biosynthesis C-methylase UbiE
MTQARAAAFDGMAQGYDAEFTATALGRVLREMVWQRFEHHFRGRESLLEIGCGTGEDAIHLAKLGHRVLAADASAQMVRVAQGKAERAGVADRIRFLCVPMEHLATHLAGEVFDGTCSNFGAMNCATSLDAVVAGLAPLLKPGAPLVWVVMGRHVPWEWAWYLARGQGRKAFRRLARGGSEWRGMRISYPSPASLGRVLKPHFTARSARSLGFALPPSYAGAWLGRAPRALAALARIEHLAQRWPGCAALADHYIFEAVRRT